MQRGNIQVLTLHVHNFQMELQPPLTQQPVCADVPDILMLHHIMVNADQTVELLNIAGIFD